MNTSNTTFWNKSQNFISHTALQVSAFESRWSQTLMPNGTNKYSLSEQRTVECFYTWTFVFICRVSHCTQYINFFIQSNLQTLLANKDCYPNKVHFTTLSVNHKKKGRNVTLVWTTLIAKQGLKWADVSDYITVSSDESFITSRYKRSPSSRIYKTIYLKMLIPFEKKEQSREEQKRNRFLFQVFSW